MFRRSLIVLCPLAIAVICCGCSVYDASVTGTVMLDGKPLGNALVTFHPVGSGALAYSQTAADGRFELRTGSQTGLRPGDYQVTVAATGPMPPPSPKNPEPAPSLITPLKYKNKETSGLKFTIANGANVLNIDLKSN